MTTTKLQLTDFHIEKLKNVVNVGRSSAYQILTQPGTVLGQFGAVADEDSRMAANDSALLPVVQASACPGRTSWIRRTLTALAAR